MARLKHFIMINQSLARSYPEHHQPIIINERFKLIEARHKGEALAKVNAFPKYTLHQLSFIGLIALKLGIYPLPVLTRGYY